MEIIIVLALIIIVYKLTWSYLFSWKAVVRHLWKSAIKKIVVIISANTYTDIQNLEKTARLEGDIINSILKYVNHIKKEQEKTGDEDEYEEETLGFGYFDFDMELMRIKQEEEESSDIQKGQS